MKSAPITMAAGVLCLAITFPNLSQAAKAAVRNADKAQIAHGEYLVKGVAGCAHCHTPTNNKGEPMPGQWLKGAKLSFAPLVPFPAWTGSSPDIAGLVGWDTEKAVRLLMTGLDANGHPPHPPMPQYHMSRADAEAVVSYLKSLK